MFQRILIHVLVYAGIFIIPLTASAQLTVVQGGGLGMTPQQLVQNVLVGGGVTVSNVTFNGSAGLINSNMIGTF